MQILQNPRGHVKLRFADFANRNLQAMYALYADVAKRLRPEAATLISQVRVLPSA